MRSLRPATSSIRILTAVLLLAIALAGFARAQQRVTLIPDPGGDGSDGAFVAGPGAILDSDVQAVWNFTTFTIPAGIVVECQGLLPIEIRVQGIARIDGVLDAAGRSGGEGRNDSDGGAGGRGGPGAAPGGDGGAPASNPFDGSGAPGQGRSGGVGGMDIGAVGGSFLDPSGGGGGAGNFRDGFPGGPANSGLTPSGSGAGGMQPSNCRAGSGGGGGAGDIDSSSDPLVNDGGGGGGGGGGRLAIYSGLVIQVGALGEIRLDGGAGGDSFGNGGGGGGGSGGFAELVAPLVSIDGFFTARGGAAGAALQATAGSAPGGRGAAGCLRVSAVVGNASRPTEPPATFTEFEMALGPRSPTVGIDVILEDPQGSYVTGMAVFLLNPPIQIPGVGLLELDPSDFVFKVVIGRPTFPPSFTGLTGGASGRISITPPPLNPATVGMDLTLYLQVFAFDANVFLNGLSETLPVRFLY